MTIAIEPRTTLYDRDLNLWVEDTIAKWQFSRDIDSMLTVNFWE